MGLFEQLGIHYPLDRVICLVGGGGKSTLLTMMAREGRRLRMRTAITTTAHLSAPSRDVSLFHTTGENQLEIERAWEQEKIVVAGTPCEDGRLGPPSMPVLDYLQRNAQLLLCKCDDAGKKPLNFSQNKPLLLHRTDCVIVVAGLFALGHPFAHACYNWQQLQDCMGIPPDRIVAPGLIAPLLVRSYGRYFPIVLLNQADNGILRSQGIEIMQTLRQADVGRVLVASLKSGVISTFSASGV